jgi:hypothetical protein
MKLTRRASALVLGFLALGCSKNGQGTAAPTAIDAPAAVDAPADAPAADAPPASADTPSTAGADKKSLTPKDLEAGTQKVYALYGKSKFDAVLAELQGLLGAAHKTEANMWTWYASDGTACKAMWVTKNEKGDAAVGALDATPADCQ